MAEYYEPNLFLSTPEHPNMMGVINHNFFLSIMQNFSSGMFFDVLLEELKRTGIACEVMGREPLKLCGLEAF